MSERDLLEGLNDSLSIEDLMRVPESQGLSEQDARLARLRGEPGSQERSIQAPDLDREFERLPQYGSASGRAERLPQEGEFSGKGSWYSQLPQYGWVDREDRPGSNALGVPDEKQGIALPSRATLGQWFDVTFPDGTSHRLQQTDVGPAKWTGKGIDISAAAAHEAGYSPKNFPTGGNFTWKPAAEGDLSYDTEDRTAVGLGGSRAYAPETTTVPDVAHQSTGRRQMADQPRGILDFLGGTGQQQQQPGGLLGMLGDPETMAYLAMIAKGASPYSNLDPNSMLSNAHTIAMRKQALEQQRLEHALDNRRADERLNLERDRFGLTRQEHADQRAQAERERQARDDFYSGRSGRPPEVTPDAATVPSTEPQSEPDKIRAQIKYYEDNMGRLGQKDQIQAQKQIDLLNKRLTPTGTEQKLYDTASGNLPQLESLKADLERAKELVPKAASNTITTFFDKMAANLGETIAGPQAMATAELDRKMKATALTELRKLLPGPASNKDVAIITDIAANPGMSPTEKMGRIGGVLQRVEAQIAKEKETIKRYRQKEGTYKPEDDAGGGGGGTDMGGGWTVRQK